MISGAVSKPEKLGLPTVAGQAGDRDKFNIQPIKGFDHYLARHWLLPNRNKASLTPAPFGLPVQGGSAVIQTTG